MADRSERLRSVARQPPPLLLAPVARWRRQQHSQHTGRAPAGAQVAGFGLPALQQPAHELRPALQRSQLRTAPCSCGRLLLLLPQQVSIILGRQSCSGRR